jgi:hypothetical protein
MDLQDVKNYVSVEISMKEKGLKENYEAINGLLKNSSDWDIDKVICNCNNLIKFASEAKNTQEQIKNLQGVLRVCNE